MQQTPLRGPEIVAFLKSGFGPTVFPIYRGGAADGQGVGPAPDQKLPVEKPFLVTRD